MSATHIESMIPAPWQVWEQEGGSIVLLVPDEYSGDAVSKIKGKIEKESNIVGLEHARISSFDGFKARYGADYDLKMYITTYKGDEVKAVSSCNHNFIKSNTQKNKLWCTICGDYK